MNVDTDWRSRDGYKAWLMNVYAIIDMARLFMGEVSRELGIEIRMGSYIDKSDSLHVYGKDIRDDQGKVGQFGDLIRRMKNTPLDNLVFDPEAISPIFIEARRLVAAQLYTEKVLGGNKATVHPALDLKTFPYPSEWDL